MKKFKLKYKDKAKIIDGFLEGMEGEIEGFRKSGIFNHKIEYWLKTNNAIGNIYVPEKLLEKLK